MTERTVQVLVPFVWGALAAAPFGALNGSFAWLVDWRYWAIIVGGRLMYLLGQHDGRIRA